MEEVGRNTLIFIPLAVLLGFIATCCLMKYCKRPQVSDIVLRVGDEDPHVDSIDYSRLLSPSQNEALKSAQPVSTSPIAAGASTAANDKRASFGRSLNESCEE